MGIYSANDTKITQIVKGTSGNLNLYASWTEKDTVVIDTEKQVYTYGTGAFEVINDQGLDGFTVEYLVSGNWTETVPTAINAYDVRVTRAECNDYKAFEQIINSGFRIVKTKPSIVLANETVTFTGEEISISPAVVTGVNSEIVSNPVTYEYYTDSACTDLMTSLPIYPGTYYVTATVEVGGNYTAATSEVATLTVEEAVFNVTLPTTLPVNVGSDGVVTVSSDVYIVNNTSIPVVVTDVTIEEANGWNLVSSSHNFSNDLVGTKNFYLGVSNPTMNTVIAKQSRLLISYIANIAPQSNELSNNHMANVVFTVGWYVPEN